MIQERVKETSNSLSELTVVPCLFPFAACLGQIPKELGALSKLQILHLNANDLTGEIRVELKLLHENNV